MPRFIHLKKTKNPWRPILERLEDRTTPVVGAYFSDASTTSDPAFNGVVKIELSDGTYGSGALMFGGNYILTAAHVVTNSAGQKLPGTIKFYPNSSNIFSPPISFTAADVSIVNGYVPNGSSIVPNDVAVINITGKAPSGIAGYELYRSSNEIGQSFTMVGFGQTGNGTNGADSSTGGIKRIGINTFEATGADVNQPALFKDLVFDFDDGTPAGNELLNRYGVPSTTGETSSNILIETDSAPGDSGGPGFLNSNGKLLIGGIVSGGTIGSAFTGLGFYSRVSAFANEIDGLTGGPVPTITSTSLFAVSPGSTSLSFSTPNVHIYDAAGLNPQTIIKDIMVYSPNFTGGVVTALGDVNHDGVIDLIAGPGPGGGPNIKVISGVDFSTVLFNFFAFEPTFSGGVTLASGDIDGDLYADILVGAGPGGGPRIKVFSGKNLTVLRDFFAFEPTFSGGVTIATGLINSDTQIDILVGAGPGGGPRLKVFDGASLGVLMDFFVYDAAFRGGINVAAGKLYDGFTDQILVGAGAGGGPNVRVYDSNKNILQDFFAYSTGFSGGVRVAPALFSSNQRGIITTPGPGNPVSSSPSDFLALHGYLGMNLLLDFYPYSSNFSGGLFVAGKVS
ncbi:MAG: trypsin-like serine protease [Gemmataceae bacterium]